MTDTALIEYGRTVDVLGTGWKFERFTRRVLADWPEEKLRLWRKRTDYSVRCSRCPRNAWVMLKTPASAKRTAEKHAAEHPGATVKEI